MKIQNKILYILLALLVIYTLMFCGYIYYSISRYTFNDFYKRLEIRAITTVKSQVDSTDYRPAIEELREEYLEKLQDEQIKIIALDKGIQTEPYPELNSYDQGFIKKLLSDSIATFSSKNVFYYGTLYTSVDSKNYLVIISAENYFMNHHFSYLKNLMITSLIIAFLIIILMSLLFSRTVFQPINDIINRVKEISSEYLHLRLDNNSGNKDDPIFKLANTFNDMLNRLETSFETQKNFISNASHELNTPLTSIRGEAEIALSKSRTKEEYVASLQGILEEVETLEKKTNALLFLAQTGFDGKKQKLIPVRIDQIILDVKEIVQKLDPSNKICLDFSLLPDNSDKLNVLANEQLLSLALSNIVMNGCKYSNQKPVSIALGVAKDKVFILIKDKGIGIPENDLPYIYDPYFRASNTIDYKGYGIGLPLARNIIKIHNGELIVSSELNQGTIVKIIMSIHKV